MSTERIHITGASGSGVTTLGRALAIRRSIPHFDTDDFYWLPTDPPYRQARAAPERVPLMQQLFVDLPGWILTGSISVWGDPLRPRFDLIVFLTAPADIRDARLHERETLRFGAEALAPGGSRHEEAEAFFDWARHYDDETFTGRTRAKHEAWLAASSCPVLRLDGADPTDLLVDAVSTWLYDNLDARRP